MVKSKLINLLVAITFITLCGCVSQTHINKQMASWGGYPITQVVDSWGPPTSVFTDVDGSKWYTWEQSGFNQYGSIQGRRQFKVVEGIVFSYRWNGQLAVTNGWGNIGNPRNRNGS